MKFDDQLAAYLYENKLLNLEGIGTFTLDSKVSVPSEQEKEVYYPIEGLQYTYNPKARTDESIIIYLVKKLSKIEPLIRSDLESYLSDIKQFLNIGKPYTIRGIGTLTKNNQGIYEFTPGSFLTAKEETHPKKEKVSHSYNNYPARSKSSAGKTFVTILVIIVALAALGGIGWGISTLISKKQLTSEERPQGYSDTVSQQANEDTLPKATTPAKPSTAVAENTSKTGDSVSYKMIFEITPSYQRAVKRTAQLNSYNTRSKYDTIRANNTLQYRLFLPVKVRPSSIERVRDSLSKFFGRKVYVEKQQ